NLRQVRQIELHRERLGHVLLGDHLQADEDLPKPPAFLRLSRQSFFELLIAEPGESLEDLAERPAAQRPRAAELAPFRRCLDARLLNPIVHGFSGVGRVSTAGCSEGCSRWPFESVAGTPSGAP